jgi:hypothetical protein
MKYLLSLLMLCASPAFASDIWVALTAQGSDTGANAANAHSIAWLNSGSNWGGGAGQVGPGTIVHLTGTFTAAALSTLIIVPADGAVGNPVTLRMETNSVFTSQCWGQPNQTTGNTWIKDGVIYVHHRSNITIDGSNQSSLVTNTADGTGLTYSTTTSAVHVEDSTNIVIQGLKCMGMYINTGNDTGGERTDIIRTDGNIVGLRVCSNILANSDAGTAINFKYLSGLEIDHNLSTNHCWGIAVTPTYGYPTSFASDNIKIHDNEITDWNNWGCPGGAYHTDGIIVWSFNHGTSMQVEMYNNYVHGGMISIPGGSCSATAFLFARWQEGDSSASVTPYMHNNLLVSTDSTTPIWSLDHDGKFYNNTVIATGGGIGLIHDKDVLGGHAHVTNNIFKGLSPAIANLDRNAVLSDYNIYNGGTYVLSEGFTVGSPAWYTLAQDQATFQNESHGSTVNPNLDSTYHLNTGSPAIGFGYNVGIATDKDGNAYPSFPTAYDAGAYIYNGSPSTNPVIHVSPSSLWFSWALTNTSLTSTFTVQNTAGGTLTGTASTSPPFSITSGASYSLTNGQSQTVTVKFLPTATGTNSGTVTCTGGGGATVAVSGFGLVQSTLSVYMTNGFIEAPMVTTSNYIYSTTDTSSGISPSNGRATFVFNVPSPDTYYATGICYWPDLSANSVFLMADREPAPTEIWGEIAGPTNSAFGPLAVILRTAEPGPYPFVLSAGNHTLIIRGREANAEIQSITFTGQSSPPAPFVGTIGTINVINENVQYQNVGTSH